MHTAAHAPRYQAWKNTIANSELALAA